MRPRGHATMGDEPLEVMQEAPRLVVTAGLQSGSSGASFIIIIHSLGLAPAGYLAASDNGA
jgi:hypothetical protein